MAAFKILSSGHSLSESPRWNNKLGIFSWVDIGTGQSFELRDSSLKIQHHDSGITSQHYLNDGKSLNTGLTSIFTTKDEKDTEVWRDESSLLSWRFNDSLLLPNGQLVVGTKSLNGRDLDQKLGVYDEGELRWFYQSMTLANGIALDTLNSRLLVADSVSQQILAWKVGDDWSVVEDKEPVVLLKVPEGQPDGITLDRHGNLWVAIWGAGRIHVYDSSFQLSRIFTFGARNVTSLALGGRSHRQILVTTAEGEEIASPVDYPCAAGDVLLIDLDC